MATPAAAESNDFSFTKDGKFLEGRAGASITVTADPGVAEILAHSAPFPPGTTKVGGLSATASGGTNAVRFGEGHGTVTFSASASASSALAVYGDTPSLLNDLDPDPEKSVLAGLVIDGTGCRQFVLLDWGYSVAANANGSIALGGGASATFAADATNNGLLAVVRGFASPPKSRDAIQSTITSWMLPRQVTSVDDLAPGTWLIAEVDGSIGVKIGVEYGYSYSWIRNVNAAGLSGDVGLKIQAGVDAAIGFDASGKYLVMVARESIDPSGKVIRVRISKMAKKGWNFALNASVGVTGSTGTLLPGQIDDFVAAVFGIHGAQVVEDLRLFDQWTDPNTPLPDLLSGFIVDYATQQLAGIAGDEIARFQAARNRVAGFLTQWEDLGHTTATMLWAAVQKGGGPLLKLLDFVTQLSGLGPAELKDIIKDALGEVDFSSNPIGPWLESVASDNVLAILNSNHLLDKVQKAAQTTVDILNGKTLNSLVGFVDRKLHIAEVEKIVNAADFNNLDPWLKGKLAKFLGKPQALFSDLDTIRTTVRTIRDKAGELYQQALKALNNTYTAAFHYTYSKAAASTALVDVSFDFAKDPSVGAFMKMAIQGDFKDLLLATSPAITLNGAELTHGVKRQSHVQVTLPYFSGTVDHLNNSLASLTVVEDKGRLFAYDLKAEDNVVRAHKWTSNLTITGKLTVAAGVRTFVTDEEVADSMTFGYSFRQAMQGMRDVQFEDQLEPLIQPYFPNAFGGPAAPEKASLHEWIGDLDNHVSAVDKTGTGNLGSVLVALDVSLPGKVVAAWFKAPRDKNAAEYFDMSRNIQRAMRRFAQFCFFNDASVYANLKSAPPVYVYGCLQVSTNIRIHNGTLTFDVDDKLYWDFEDTSKQRTMAFASRNAVALRMAGIQRVLMDSEKFRKQAGFYDPHKAGDAIETALKDPRFSGLLFTEAQIIGHAQSAGVKLAQFSSVAGTDPEQALEALEEFGAKITDAFNGRLGGLIPRLEEFSAMIFLEAARAFDPTLVNVRPWARLDTILLKRGTPDLVADLFLGGEAPDPSVISVEQPVVGIP